jgi:hypothetical protein
VAAPVGVGLGEGWRCARPPGDPATAAAGGAHPGPGGNAVARGPGGPKIVRPPPRGMPVACWIGVTQRPQSSTLARDRRRRPPAARKQIRRTAPKAEDRPPSAGRPRSNPLPSPWGRRDPGGPGEQPGARAARAPGKRGGRGDGLDICQPAQPGRPDQGRPASPPNKRERGADLLPPPNGPCSTSCERARVHSPITLMIIRFGRRPSNSV